MTQDTQLRQLDAANRGLRTLVQGLGYDVIAAVVIVLVTAFAEGTGWGSLQWSLISYSVVKSVLVSVLAYLMRLRGGRLLPPPNPQPEPNLDVEEGTSWSPPPPPLLPPPGG
jgi:hypothetical protein